MAPPRSVAGDSETDNHAAARGVDPACATGWASMTISAQDTVERMIHEGTPFEDIEQYIETVALPSEQLAALWLLAWAEATDPVTRRRVVAEALASSDGLPGSPVGAAPSASARVSHGERRLAPVTSGSVHPKRAGRQRRRR
jgi:hypothetical protein